MDVNESLSSRQTNVCSCCLVSGTVVAGALLITGVVLHVLSTIPTSASYAMIGIGGGWLGITFIRTCCNALNRHAERDLANIKKTTSDLCSRRNMWAICHEINEDLCTKIPEESKYLIHRDPNIFNASVDVNNRPFALTPTQSVLTILIQGDPKNRAVPRFLSHFIIESVGNNDIPKWKFVVNEEDSCPNQLSPVCYKNQEFTIEEMVQHLTTDPVIWKMPGDKSYNHIQLMQIKDYVFQIYTTDEGSVSYKMQQYNDQTSSFLIPCLSRRGVQEIIESNRFPDFIKNNIDNFLHKHDPQQPK